jgi:trimeric autotransporter adhesin
VRSDVREVLVQHGTTAAQDHPAQVDRGLRKGTRLFWRRLLLVNIAAAVAALVLFFVLGASSGHVDIPLTLSPRLMQITVSPSEVHLSPGESRQLVARGAYDDGTRELITNATWRSSRPEVAKVVQGTGMVTALRQGTAVIIAEGKSGITKSVPVVVDPSSHRLTAIRVLPGSQVATPRQRVQFAALAVFSDGTSRDISNVVQWRTGGDQVAKIDGRGLATALSPGSTPVRATWHGLTAPATLAVRKEPAGSPSPTASTTTTATAVLTGITIEPLTEKFAVDESLQLKATGTYDDETTRDLTGVAWSVVDANGVATVTSTGVVSGTNPGSIRIAAKMDDFEKEIVIAVVRLESITIDGTTSDVCQPDTVPLRARARYDDGTSEDVTATVVWGSDDRKVATVDSRGVVTGRGPGRALITATLFGVASSTTVACGA